MKKIVKILGLSLILVSASSFLFAEETTVTTDNGNSVETKVVKTEKTKKSKKNKKEDINLSKEEMDALKQGKIKKNAVLKKDPYTGWIYVEKDNIRLDKGNIHLTVNGKTGCFGISAIPENLKMIPLLSNVDGSSTSFFVVKIGNKTYRLNRENGVECESRLTPYGAQLCYTIPHSAQILVDFSFLPSIASSSRVDMLRVMIYVTNLSSKTKSFAVKGVFDTCLGESYKTHFSTAQTRVINGEKQYISMNDDLWIRSANDYTSIQFLLCGKGITEPKMVTLGNKDNLVSNSWIPTVQDSKSFSSVLSYNNSAVCINWNEDFIDPLKNDVNVFYISVETDGNEPAGKKFLASLETGNAALSPKKNEEVKYSDATPKVEKVDESQLQTEYYKNMPVEALKTVKPKLDSSNSYYSQDEDSPVIPEYAELDEGKSVKVEGPGASKAAENTSVSEKQVSVETPKAVENKPLETQKSVQSSSEKITIPEVVPQTNVPVKNDTTVNIKSDDPQLQPEYIQGILDRINELEQSGDDIDINELNRLNSELDEIFEKLKD